MVIYGHLSIVVVANTLKIIQSGIPFITHYHNFSQHLSIARAILSSYTVDFPEGDDIIGVVLLGDTVTPSEFDGKIPPLTGLRPL